MMFGGKAIHQLLRERLQSQVASSPVFKSLISKKGNGNAESASKSSLRKISLFGAGVSESSSAANSASKEMHRTVAYSKVLPRPLLAAARGFCASPSKIDSGEKIVAAVLFERLPVVVPKIDPVVYAFQEFSFRWRQQYRREFPDSFLQKSDSRGQGDHQIDYVPAPRITEAHKTNDKKSLQRALDRRLYLLLYGKSNDSNEKLAWHFPEKVFESEPTLRKCAESALESVVGDISNTYFVGNAPLGHMIIQPTEKDKVNASLKRFFFKSQVIATNKFDIGKCEDYAWVTKDELLEYFPEQVDYLNKMIMS